MFSTAHLFHLCLTLLSLSVLWPIAAIPLLSLLGKDLPTFLKVGGGCPQVLPLGTLRGKTFRMSLCICEHS
jgi:hypothetical protein